MYMDWRAETLSALRVLGKQYRGWAAACKEYEMKSKSRYQKAVRVIMAFFISFACTASFHRPDVPGNYEEHIDYLLAQVTELLGEYTFPAVLLFVLALVFLEYTDARFTAHKERGEKKLPGYLLPAFFSVCLFLGRSYQETNSWVYCFGSLVNVIKFGAACLGMTVLLHRVLILLQEFYERGSGSRWQCGLSRWLFGERCFRRIFLLLFLLWLPILLLSFPGNLCYDVLGQIDQVAGSAPYSAHHPLLHTLLVGGMTELGHRLTGSYDAGLFAYVLFQAALLSSALAGTVWWLSRQEFARGRVSHPMLLAILGIYVFSPMYSNMASTAIKDVPFLAAFIWYMILLAEVYFHRERLREPVFVGILLVTEVLMSLLRNNGFYVLFLTGLVLTAAWWKRAGKRERLSAFFYLFLIPVLLSRVFGGLLLTGLSAEKGKAAEMLSLPFQQTARYLQLYRQELTPWEEQAIAAVLGEAGEIAASYDPKLADPVKSLYYAQEPVTGRELAQYGMVWFRDFFKHPFVYLEAFFAHVYGWFDPQVSNSPRYEAVSDLFSRSGLFAGADKVLIFIYRFAERITPLGLLQNAGAYTWALLFLFGYLLRKNRDLAALPMPLLVSLLICLASPCFYLHPRYAYPYMFTIPFLYGLAERSRK